MKLTRLFIAAALCCTSFTGAQAQTQIIAHRGYWKCEGSAQNSITALQKAAAIGVYGSEFDVQLTKDHQVVVNHDDSIDGKRISDITYAELKNVRLRNGEPIPTLDDYLKAGKALPKVQLILEIKPHRTRAEEEAVSSLVVQKVQQMNMEKQVEYISFSLYICEQLAKLSPTSKIAYLEGDVAPKALKKKGINGIDYHHKIYKKKPEWIQEAHQLDMKVNVWTVNKPELIQEMKDLQVDFITTDHPEEAMK